MLLTDIGSIADKKNLVEVKKEFGIFERLRAKLFIISSVTKYHKLYYGSSSKEEIIIWSIAPNCFNNFCFFSFFKTLNVLKNSLCFSLN